jgi:protoporphyrinogen/coproporphyrinogen III oxidase
VSSSSRNQLSQPVANPRSRRVAVAVVGAGISGLSAAYALAQAKVPFLLLEAANRPGGVLQTVQMDGCLVEGGPDSYLAQKPWATRLIRKLGIADDLIGSNDAHRKTFIVRQQRLVAMPDGLLMMVPTKVMPMITTRLLGWPTKFRMGLELFRGKPSRQREHDPSVADFFRDHYGQEAVDYLAEPLLAGVYGGDPERMSARSVLGRFMDLESRYGSLSRGVLQERRKAKRDGGAGPLFRSLRWGMGSLVDALVDAIGNESIRYGFAVQRLEQHEAGFALQAGEETIIAGQLILALPAYAAATLLRPLHTLLADLLGRIRYHSSATVALTFDRAQFDSPPLGFGFLVPKKERQTLVAATYVQNKFPHRTPEGKVLLRCFVGKAAEEDAALRDDGLLLQAVRDDLLRLTGLRAEPQ